MTFGAGGLYPSELCGRILLLGVPPAFDHDLNFPHRVADFPFEHFIKQFAIEAFLVAIPPGTSWFNEESLHPTLL